MSRIAINRSVSFDPQIFERMEERRRKLLMDRSEYIKSCIMKDMLPGGQMNIQEVPDEFLRKDPEKPRARSRKKG